jgi:phosphomannomutase
MKNATQMKNAKPQPRRFDPEVLREYDIRGQVGKNLSAADALAVGLSFGTYVRRKGGKNVCVGYDGRASSPGFAQAVIEGLAATGLNVEAIGLGPTPMLYYAVKEHKADGGVMITGSHNPADYNGFKMTLARDPVYGEAVQELGRIAAAGDYATGKGAVTETDIQDAYVERLARDWNGKKNLKVAWDCGNGAAGEIVRRLVRILPGEHILLFDEIDGNFPNHHPDPTVDKNLADLIRTVKEKKFDLGVAFDGDADRIGAVDEKGHVLRCDTMIALYAREVLNDFPGATIVGDVKCSQIMYDEVARLGGKPLMWKTGHSLIKAKMYELNAPLAGELSGHIFFGHKFYGHDDGIYCAVRLMNIVANAGTPASGLTAHLPGIFNTPEIRFEVDEKEKFNLVRRVAESVKARKNESWRVNEIDGVRVTTPEGWWLLRASNTQNVLVTRAESQSAVGLEILKSMVKSEVERIGYDIAITG